MDEVAAASPGVELHVILDNLSIHPDSPPMLDFSGNRAYIQGMSRWLTFFQARTLALSLALALLAPTLMCGWSPATEKDAQTCCRAMQMACHRGQENSACCQSKPSAPQLVAAMQRLRSGFTAVQPVQMAVLPAMRRRAMHWSYLSLPVAGGHSPPGGVPVFLINSTLLI